MLKICKTCEKELYPKDKENTCLDCWMKSKFYKLDVWNMIHPVDISRPAVRYVSRGYKV